MKPSSRSNPFLRAPLTPAVGYTLALCIAGMTPTVWATPQTWDGGVAGTGTTLQTTTNWNGDTTVPGSGELATFSNLNGTGGNLSLTYDNTYTGGGNGVSIAVLGLHTGSLTIDPGANSTPLRMRDITIDAGAGAFTFGNGDANLTNLTFGSTSANTNTFINNSGNLATFKSDVRFASGGAVNPRTVTFDGSGNWQVDAALKPSQTIGGAVTNNAAGGFALVKKGTGSLALNANSTGNNANNDAIGLRSVMIEQGNVLAGATGALGSTVGAAGVTLGLAGGNSASLLNTGSFTQGNNITVASGNTGTLRIGGNHTSGVSAYTGNLILNSNLVLSAASGGQVDFTTGVISGAGNVTVSGGGMIALSGTNIYTERRPSNMEFCGRREMRQSATRPRPSPWAMRRRSVPT